MPAESGKRKRQKTHKPQHFAQARKKCAAGSKAVDRAYFSSKRTIFSSGRGKKNSWTKTSSQHHPFLGLSYFCCPLFWLPACPLLQYVCFFWGGVGGWVGPSFGSRPIPCSNMYAFFGVRKSPKKPSGDSKVSLSLGSVGNLKKNSSGVRILGTYVPRT